MARQTGVVTYPTLVAFKADTIIDQQVGDTVQIENVLKQGVTHTSRTAGAETPDDKYTIRKTNDASLTFWASSISSLVEGSVNVAFSELPDATEDEIAVTVTGAVTGKAYNFGVVSGLPNGVEMILKPVITDDEIVFLIKNNTGETLTAGTVVVNVYE